MGGDCSQKAHALEGTAILSWALRASGSVRIKTLSQRGLARRAGAGPIWKRSAKRRQALVETNPPRNSRSQTHQNDGTRGEAVNGLAPALQPKTKSD
jgi:hypothetical protein